MTGYVVVILIVMVGGIVVIGVLTQLAQSTSRQWNELAGRFPAQAPAPDAVRGEAQIEVGLHPARFGGRGCLWVLMPWTWTRGLRQVRYVVDDEHLHLETEGGRLAPRSAMSIPWGEIDMEGRVSTHMGEHIVLRVDEVAIAMPSQAVERELRIRSEMDSASAPDEDPHAEPGGEAFDLTEDL